MRKKYINLDSYDNTILVLSSRDIKELSAYADAPPEKVRSLTFEYGNLVHDTVTIKTREEVDKVSVYEGCELVQELIVERIRKNTSKIVEQFEYNMSLRDYISYMSVFERELKIANANDDSAAREANVSVIATIKDPYFHAENIEI